MGEMWPGGGEGGWERERERERERESESESTSHRASLSQRWWWQELFFVTFVSELATMAIDWCYYFFVLSLISDTNCLIWSNTTITNERVYVRPCFTCHLSIVFRDMEMFHSLSCYISTSTLLHIALVWNSSFLIEFFLSLSLSLSLSHSLQWLSPLSATLLSPLSSLDSISVPPNHTYQST